MPEPSPSTAGSKHAGRHERARSRGNETARAALQGMVRGQTAHLHPSDTRELMIPLPAPEQQEAIDAAKLAWEAKMYAQMKREKAKLTLVEAEEKGEALAREGRVLERAQL